MKRICTLFVALFVVLALIPHTFAEASDTTPALTEVNSADYASFEDAAAQLRNQLKQRNPAFAIRVATEETDMESFCYSLMDVATMHTGVPTEGDYIRFHTKQVSMTPEYETVDGVNYVMIQFSIDYFSTAEQEAELDSAVDAVLNQLNLAGKHDYEKIKAIYNYITENITYDYAHKEDESYDLKATAYAALIQKTCVCQGYANLLYRMALASGIDCRIISGLGNDEAHAWNIVYVDGYYYNVDSTWDAERHQAGMPYEYFLKTETFVNHYRDEEYSTDSFHEEYPIGIEDYHYILEGLQDGNYTYTLYDNEYVIITKYIGNEAHVTVPNSLGGYPVIELWQYVFDSNNTMVSVTFSEGIMYLDPAWARYCDALEEIHLSSTIYLYNDIGSNVHSGLAGVPYHCGNIKVITVPDENEYLTVYNGTLYSKDMKTLFYHPSAHPATALEIPEGVIAINDSACAYALNLQEVIMPDTVTSIGYFAFEDAYNLEKVRISESCEVAHQFFLKNTAIKKIHIPASLWIWDPWLFGTHMLEEITVDPDSPNYFVMGGSLCHKTENDAVPFLRYPSGRPDTSYDIPYGVTMTRGYAFEGAWNLENITVPETVSYIEHYTFCESLKTITFLGDAPDRICEEAFYGVNGVLAYYPADREGWTSDMFLNYGGTVTWIPYCSGQHACDSMTVTKEPTCTESGEKTGVCKVCGESFTEIIPSGGGHSFDEGVQTVAPTCTNQGVLTYTCTLCGVNEEEYIQPLGHKINSHSYVTNSKQHKGVCSVCSVEIVSNCSPDKGNVIQEATMTQKGMISYNCTQCGGVWEEEFAYRIYGSNRYETSFTVADALKEQLGVRKFESIVVASGTGFADALAGSYLAVQKNAPILLVNKNTTANVADYIEANLASGGTIYLLGGEAAVPAAMEADLEGLNVIRLAGANRYATNLLILEEAGFAGEEILVCTGNGFADSLSASAVGKPILLVNKALTVEQKEFLELTSGKFVIIGGTGAVSAAVENALEEYGAVERLAGANRYETSVLVAETFFDAPTSAVLAYSQNFPDGLCGGPLAAATNSPLLLMATNRGDNVIEYAQKVGISCGAVLGGTGLINDTTAKELFSMK